jgi:ATP-dependent DNA ligase
MTKKVIYPPRPKNRVMPTELARLEKMDKYVCQPKYQGSRICVHISPEGEVSSCDRHGSTHDTFQLSPQQVQEILALPGRQKGLEYWLDGEVLIKTKAKDTKGKIVFFDILQAGKYLFMKPNQMARLAMLDELCGHARNIDPWRGIAYQVSENILLSPYFDKDFADAFKKYTNDDEVEGLVLRDKKSVLDNFGQREYEVTWLVRCRKPHRNYNF